MIEEQCFVCAYDNEYVLEEHHIVPRRFGGSDDESNLVTLCANCHGAIEKIYNRSFYNALGVAPPAEENRYTTVIRTERSALVPRGAVDLKTDPDEPLSVSTSVLKESRELSHCMDALAPHEFSKLHHRDKFELLLTQHEGTVGQALTQVFRDNYPEKAADEPHADIGNDIDIEEGEDSKTGRETPILDRLDEMGL